MSEDPQNIGKVHKKCAEKRKYQWQKNHKLSDVEIKDYVKIKFVEENRTEHMWIQITEILENGQLKGTIENEPVVIKNKLYKSSHSFHFSEIQDLIKRKG